jgi:hypothetical protein
MDSYGEAQEACAAALARMAARPHTTAPLLLALRCRDVLLDQAQQRLELVLGVPPEPPANHHPPRLLGAVATEDIMRVPARRADPEPRRLLDLIARRTRVGDEAPLTDLMQVTAGESPLWVGAARAAVLATDHLQQDHRFWPRPAAGWLVVADAADLAAAVCLLDETLAAHPATDPELRGRLLDPAREHLDTVAGLTRRIAGSDQLDGRVDLTHRRRPVRPVVVHDQVSVLAGATALAAMLSARAVLPVLELRTVLTGQARVYAELARLAAAAEPRGGRAHRLHRHAGMLRDTAAATVKLATLQPPQAPGAAVRQTGELARYLAQIPDAQAGRLQDTLLREVEPRVLRGMHATAAGMLVGLAEGTYLVPDTDGPAIGWRRQRPGEQTPAQTMATGLRAIQLPKATTPRPATAPPAPARAQLLEQLRARPARYTRPATPVTRRGGPSR